MDPILTPSNPRKVLLGLIGAGIQRSLTPALHEEEGARQGLRLHYQIIDLEGAGASVDALPNLISAARAFGFAGLNITYPCKQAVISLVDELSDEARTMGAVNTIVFREGRAIGHNTDGSGWTWGFRRALPAADLSRVVLLGAGGAGSAIAHATLRLGVNQLIICDVDPRRATHLAIELNECYGGQRVSASSDIAKAMDHASGLIHATPTGMAKLPGMPLPESLLRSTLWLSEIVYFPLETALLKRARALGCATIDGGGMAVGQALGAFELFTGITPDAMRLQNHFRGMIAARAGA